jgi:hypothetical protein
MAKLLQVQGRSSNYPKAVAHSFRRLNKNIYNSSIKRKKKYSPELLNNLLPADKVTINFSFSREISTTGALSF